MDWRHDQPGKHLQWETVFVDAFDASWKDRASESSSNDTCGAFVHKAYAKIGARTQEDRFRSITSHTCSEPSLCLRRKKPRIVDRLRIQWQEAPSTGRRVELVGDSKVIVQWLRGCWCVKYRQYRSRVAFLHKQWDLLRSNSLLIPPIDHMDCIRHVYRELNAEADSKANAGRVDGRSTWVDMPTLESNAFQFLRIYFDGSFKDGKCGAGFVVSCSGNPGPNDDSWDLLAWMAFPVSGKSITAAELEAAAAGQAFLAALLHGPAHVHAFLQTWEPYNYSEGAW